MTITTVNPTTGQTLADYPEMSNSQVEDILNKADSAFQIWRRTNLKDRVEPLIILASLLDANKAEYAELMSEEMGKPFFWG